MAASLMALKGGGGAEEEDVKDEEECGGKKATRQSGKTLFFLSSLLITTAQPTLTQFINNAECGAPRCCEVFVNGRANCNKQQQCLSHPAGTTLLIRTTWIDGTQEREGGGGQRQARPKETESQQRTSRRGRHSKAREGELSCKETAG